MIAIAGRIAATLVLAVSGILVFALPAQAGTQLNRCLRDEAAGNSDMKTIHDRLGSGPSYEASVGLNPGEAVAVKANPATNVNIEATPWSAQYNPMGTGVATVGFPLPGAPRYGLIGGPKGEFRFLGLTYCYENTSDKRQDFWLTINDSKTGDNGGGWEVTTVVYRPTPDPDPPMPEPATPRFGVPTAPDPALAMDRCNRADGGTLIPTPGALNGGNGWKPLSFTLQPGEVYRARAVDSYTSYVSLDGTYSPGERKPPRIRVGLWPWDGSYGPNGTGWSDVAPQGWPAPGVPKFGLIGAWNGLPGYYWVGGEAPCIQWTGSTPVTVLLTMNDPKIDDNDGGWKVEIDVYSPYVRWP